MAIQFNFYSGTSGTASGLTGTPAQATGDLGARPTDYNEVSATNPTRQVVYADGTAATGVSLNLGSGTGSGAVNWTNESFVGKVSSAGFGGVWSTPLMNAGYIYNDGNTLGAQVTGLPAGTYDVYGLDSCGANTFSMYSQIGVNTNTPSTTVTQTLQGNSPAAWVAGQTYLFATVTISAGQSIDFITYTTENNGYFAMDGLQIVQQVPPITWSGANSVNWSDSGNWTGGTPTAGVSAIFSNNANTAISLGGNQQIGAITFDNTSGTAGTSPSTPRTP